MRDRKIKLQGRDVGEVLWNGTRYILLTVFVLLCVYPFYYVIIYSLSNPELAARGVYLWPKGFTLNNYKEVFELGDLFPAFCISVLRTVLGTVISVVCTSMLAYLVTKDMWGRKVVYRIIVVTMYLNGGLLPWYLVMNAYSLTNNFLAYIVPSAINAYNMILIKTFVEQLPPSLEESAAVEGAGFFTTFFRIILPLSKPIIATISVYCMVGQWNSWKDNFFLNTDLKLQTMQLILRKYLTQAEALLLAAQNSDVQMSVTETQVTPETIQMTSVVVTMIPIMLVYPFAQKYFTKGIMLGAVKG